MYWSFSDTDAIIKGELKKGAIAQVDINKNGEFKLKIGKEIKLQFWDTPGAERFRAINKQYYKKRIVQ